MSGFISALRNVALAGFAAIASPAAGDPPNSSAFEAVRSADLAVETVGERLAIANLPLCKSVQNHLGLVVHDLLQYPSTERDAARTAFQFEREIAIAAVVRGGPADKAAALPGMSIETVNGAAVPEHGGSAAYASGGVTDYQRIEHFRDLLDMAAQKGPVMLGTVLDGGRRVLQLNGVPGCAARFDLLMDGDGASSDGHYVQIGSALYDETRNDDELAAVIAHELAHAILGHKARLDAAGIHRGLLRLNPRDADAIKKTEEEADRLSMHLLANANYDGRRALAFWKRFLPRHDFGMLSDPTHMRFKPRLELLEQEWAVAEAMRQGRSPSAPAFMSPLRDVFRANADVHEDGRAKTP